MSILVVGSVAFDNIATPSGTRGKRAGRCGHPLCAGGQLLHRGAGGGRGGRRLPAGTRRGIEESAASTRAALSARPGKTFRWGGHYTDNLNEAKTDFTALNVFEKFEPKIPKAYADTQFLFLANIHPVAADRGAARDERRPADGRRHDEFLDQRNAARTGGDACRWWTCC